jgi:thiol-disulfide isomerase/thioredoxin
MPELNQIYEKYKNDKAVVFAAITFDKKEKVDAFLKIKAYNYPMITDDKATISTFKVQSYPTNMIIGKDGTYAYYKTGGFSGIDKYIEDSIKKALKAN